MQAASPNVARLPTRLRIVPDTQFALDARQQTAGLAYRRLRIRFERATRSFRARPGGARLPETE